MFASVRIATGQQASGVAVPREAVIYEADTARLWVVADDGSVSAKVVRPGPKIDGYRLIRSGLDGTETIVINGLQRVRPGGKVTAERQELPPVKS